MSPDASILPGSLDIVDYQANSRVLDFLNLRNACPKGLYVTPVPDDENLWQGIIFVRKGPYSPGAFRFQIYFPVQYPHRPPLISFLSDIFHPLISPLTTYTFSNQDNGAETVSAGDEDRLSPGSFSLRHGFPQWFRQASPISKPGDLRMNEEKLSPTGISPDGQRSSLHSEPGAANLPWDPPHIAVLLFYLRAALSSVEFLDTIPQEAAANPSAWHAWRTFSSKRENRSSSIRSKSDAGQSAAASLRQQPGGARSPGEWNWDGVWEDRVRKCIQASLSDQSTYKKTSGAEDLIQFSNIDQETLESAKHWKAEAEL
ncbi:ubiquitin-conjugating enzyme E2 2 [Sphaceloma murrayae]|uniref:Ubiquitin-conjugating enzyme E2 2 n=1 Tax=Sphaceloma murrayae TaxID=2082308 RepID=A0A2K1QJ39_9PEZI|nr:ubiquitin-conjugating enzyme E2 2 [Sphaceloma murrayae]